jgi:hypothetical protein
MGDRVSAGGFGRNLLSPAAIREISDDPVKRDSWLRWLAAGQGGTKDPRLLRYNSFSGADMKAAIWIPPHKDNVSGSYKIWGELQTITVSSERPAGPVRSCGVAAVRGHVSGVRTIAGSMIFTVLDKDVFADVYQKYETESDARYPMYVDQIPPFHVIVHASNEYGFHASSGIVGIRLTNFGTTYSIEDLMTEATYTYVARYVHPFVNPKEWRTGLAEAVSRIEGSQLRAASGMRYSWPLGRYKINSMRQDDPARGVKHSFQPHTTISEATSRAIGPDLDY